MGEHIHNAVDGQVSGNVVQAGTVRDIHFHGSDAPRARPRMVRPPADHFTNQVRALDHADRIWAGADAHRAATITVVGLPGLGKTEFAQAWLDRHRDEFPDGDFLAELTASPADDGVVSTRLRDFLLAVGYPSASISDNLEGRSAAWRSWSTGKRVAVLVDDALRSSQVTMLTPGPGPSVVLVTARGRITGLGGRAVVDLAPLEDDAALALLGRLVDDERLTREPDATAALVGFCGGLPIAVCVAGATLAAYPNRRVARLVADLEDRRRALAMLGKVADLSVTALFDTAYERIGAEARACYHLLGAHPGTADVHLSTVAAVLNISEPHARDLADELLAAGLAQEPVDDRLALHALVRLHARDAAEPDHADLLSRTLRHYHRIGVAAGHAVMPGRPWRDRLAPHLAQFDPHAPADPMDWLVAEQPNLLAVAKAAPPEIQTELALMLWPLYEHTKSHDDLAAVSELGVRNASTPDFKAILLIQQGFAALQRGAPTAASALFRDAQGIAESPDLRATATESLGLAALAAGDPDAEALLRHNLALAIGLGDPRRVALARLHLSKACPAGEAAELAGEAARWFADREPVNSAKSLLALGCALVRADRHDAAVAQLTDALERLSQLERPFDEAQALIALGDTGTADAAQFRQRAQVIIDTYGYRNLVRSVDTEPADPRPEAD